MELQVLPSEHVFIEIHPLDVIPEGTVLHKDTFSVHKGIRPQAGLESFLEHSREWKVVMR